MTEPPSVRRLDPHLRVAFRWDDPSKLVRIIIEVYPTKIAFRTMNDRAKCIDWVLIHPGTYAVTVNCWGLDYLAQQSTVQRIFLDKL